MPDSKVLYRVRDALSNCFGGVFPANLLHEKGPRGAVLSLSFSLYFYLSKQEKFTRMIAEIFVDGREAVAKLV
jgi:hypothetical protein